MKILTIGNSFSQDATAYMERIALSDIYVRNLFIPGCDLKMHCDNIITNEKAYEYQKNGKKLCMISLEKALKKEQWNVITIQQVSHLSGILNSYFPYISELINYIKQNVPNTKIMLHKTWPYAHGCQHSYFSDYNNNTKTMYDSINRTVKIISAQFNIPVIKTGDCIYNSYTECLFNPDYEGISLFRDGFHLSIPHGRYLAALCFYLHFYNKDRINLKYLPKGMTHKQRDCLQSLAMKHLWQNKDGMMTQPSL